MRSERLVPEPDLTPGAASADHASALRRIRRIFPSGDAWDGLGFLDLTQQLGKLRRLP
jgi:hypothetical protein